MFCFRFVFVYLTNQCAYAAGSSSLLLFPPLRNWSASCNQFFLYCVKDVYSVCLQCVYIWILDSSVPIHYVCCCVEARSRDGQSWYPRNCSGLFEGPGAARCRVVSCDCIAGMVIDAARWRAVTDNSACFHLVCHVFPPSLSDLVRMAVWDFAHRRIPQVACTSLWAPRRTSLTCY